MTTPDRDLEDTRTPESYYHIVNEINPPIKGEDAHMRYTTTAQPGIVEPTPDMFRAQVAKHEELQRAAIDRILKLQDEKALLRLSLDDIAHVAGNHEDFTIAEYAYALNWIYREATK